MLVAHCRRAVLATIATVAVASAGSAQAIGPFAQVIGGAGPLSMKNVPACIKDNGRRARDVCLFPVSQQQPAAAIAKAHEERAIILVWLYDYDAARRELDQAVTANPFSAAAHHLAARFALSDHVIRGTRQALGDAKAQLEAARKLAPDDADIRATVAYVSAAEGNADAALTAFEIVLATAPNHLFALAQHAELLAKRGKLDEAVADYSRIISVAPDDCTDARIARAGLLLRRDEPVAAVIDLDAVLDAEPATMLALLARANAFERLGNDAAAARDLGHLIDGLEDGTRFALGADQIAGLLMRRALAFAHLDRRMEAVADMEHALKLGNKPQLLRLEIFLRRHGFPDVPIDGKPSARLPRRSSNASTQALAAAR